MTPLYAIVAFGSVTISAEASAKTFVIQPLRSEVATTESVGPKRTGLLCGPAGSVLWGEAAPDPALTATAIAAALRDQQFAAVSSDDADGEPGQSGQAQRVRASVIAAHIEACVPQHGLFRLAGGRKRLKAQGWVKVRWTFSPSGIGEQPVDTEVTEPIAVDEQHPTLPTAVQAAVVQSARQLIPLLVGKAG